MLYQAELFPDRGRHIAVPARQEPPYSEAIWSWQAAIVNFIRSEQSFRAEAELAACAFDQMVVQFYAEQAEDIRKTAGCRNVRLAGGDEAGWMPMP